MNKTIFFFPLLFCMFSLYCGDFDTFRISKIRIFCDKAEYIWTTDGLERMDEDRTKVVLNAETIVTFLSIKPDFYGTEKEILKRCEDSQRRMTDSGYFYESSVMVVPPNKFLSERTLIVSVSPGYFMRYGGGSVWGMYGLIGIGGARQSLYAYAGYN
ncbi:MAG TPA: hypothetical protein VJ861_03090, partial [Treponemataceae bacterium]|nr:hypothetical protein [Treponemataceae bacterium]